MREASGECVFCNIAVGKEPASIMYEDGAVMAFMDIAQPRHGHGLIIPKQHVQDIFELDDETGAVLISALRRVALATKEAFQPEGITVWQQNGPPWQEVPHLHFHVLPRYRGDSLMRPWPTPLQPAPRDELDRQAALIRQALADVS